MHDEPVLACPPSAWYRFRKFAATQGGATNSRGGCPGVTAGSRGRHLDAFGPGSAAAPSCPAHGRDRTNGRRRALIQTDRWRKQAGEAHERDGQEADAVLALWRQAEASLAQAEAALRTGTADNRLRRRVLAIRQQIGQQREQAQRTAILLRDLDDARMTQSICIEGHYDNAGAATSMPRRSRHTVWK